MEELTPEEKELYEQIAEETRKVNRARKELKEQQQEGDD